MPTLIFQWWILGFFSLALIGTAIYFGREWFLASWTYDPVSDRSFFDPQLGANEPTAFLAGALILLLISFFGGHLVKAVLRLLKGHSDPERDPNAAVAKPTGHQHIRRPDGSDIHVEFYGSPSAVPIVLTHGWGLNGREWNYLKRDLSQHFYLIVWDEPGLGDSSGPRDRNYSVERLALDLDAVVNLAGPRPAFLLGHSIGGMMILTFCRLFRETLERRVSGVILTHTTYTNPLRTMKRAGFYQAIEKPVLRPLLWLTIWLSSFVRLMNWMSYRNGTAHLSTKHSSFAGTESWEEIDFATQFTPKAAPAVVARGVLGMLEFDETDTLRMIPVPTLVIAGDRDSTTLPAASERIHAEIPSAKIQTLFPAKHLGLIEHREEYSKAVREFVMASRATAEQDAVPGERAA